MTLHKLFHILSCSKPILCHSKYRLIEVSIKGLNTAFYKVPGNFWWRGNQKKKCQNIDMASTYWH